MNLKSTALVLLTSLSVLTACKKDKDPEPEPKPDFEQVSKYIKKYNNGVIEITRMPVPDTTATNRRAWAYFSFDKMEFVSKDKVMTKEWDMGFQGRTVYVITGNNGIAGNEEDLYWQNESRVYIKSFFSKFDDFNAVPANIDLTKDYDAYNVISSAQENLPVYTQFPFYWAYYNYNIDKEFTHLVPYTNCIHLFKLTDGRYVKLQLINTYNNEPEKNSPSSRPGYISMRYYISKAGSTDLKTK
jgi:heme-binding HmuY-like protein